VSRAGGNVDLDGLAASLHETWELAAQADLMMNRGDLLGARQFVQQARDRAQKTYGALLSAGAKPATGTAGPADPVPLRLLNTHASRRLLNVLRDAQEAAEAVDAERGHVLPPDVPLQSGESRGTGYAEAVSEITERCRVEVEGPQRAAGRE
jgi:hypothetical protein